ncbi:CHAT domain-containing protein [Mycena amicta]|nr:CHAT domain-containing protein [Mycena amicta]
MSDSEHMSDYSDSNDHGNLGAIYQAEMVVKQAPPEDPDLPEYLWRLGEAWQVRYRQEGDMADLNMAFQNYEKAIQLAPPGHATRAMCLRCLSLCLQDRYRESGSMTDLEAALQYSQEAVLLLPKGDSDKPRCLHLLALCLRDRYRRLGNPDDLKAAIHSNQEAVDLTPEVCLDRVTFLNDLAVSFSDQYKKGSDLSDLSRALGTYEEAVEISPPDDPEKAELLRDLGILYLDRYRRLGAIQDLEAALRRHQEAVDLVPEWHNNKASFLSYLVICLRTRYLKLGAIRDLEAAVEKGQEAVKIALDYLEHPDTPMILVGLASCLWARHDHSGKLDDLVAALETAQQASSWKNALQWASFSEKADSMHSLAAYKAAFDLLPEMLWIGHSIPIRQAILHEMHIEQATAKAVWAYISHSKITSAVEVLEQGIAIIFQQSLQLRTDSSNLPIEQEKEFTRLSSQLYSGIIMDPTKTMDIVIQRNAILAEIRQKPHLRNFLKPQPYDVLCQAATGGPVVILNSTGSRCDAILILNPISDPVHLPLPNMDLKLLKSNQTKLKEILGKYNIHDQAQARSTRLLANREGSRKQTKEEGFEDILACLWMYIVAPIYQVLETHGISSGRLWWLPTGSFTGLPFHACAPNDKFIHSFTTTLGSLVTAYAKKDLNITNDVGIIGVARSGSRHYNYLKGVKEEVEKLISIFPNAQVLEGQQATVDAVKQLLQQCSCLHFACHGKQDIREPTKSHLVLHGGNLTLETVLRMPLPHAKFVFLAACETAMGDGELVNESFHLVGGFIAAGFHSAIGTLWSMDDQDGPLVAEVVYSHLFLHEHPTSNSAAEALHIAIKRLRSNRVPYERWIQFIHMGI